MQITVLASGSNGNATLVEDKHTSILIDAGKSIKEMKARAEKLGKSLENLNAVVLTHAHSDHYQSVGALSRRYHIPAYIAPEVYADCSRQLGNIDHKVFSTHKAFSINTLDMHPIPVSHDVPNCGFLINDFAFFTDTGTVTLPMMHAIKKAKAALIESNHDIDKLLHCSYPDFTKQRILSDNGHLSNIQASSAIQQHGKHLAWVLLGHLSENSNTPQLAKTTFEHIVTPRVEYETLSRVKASGTWEI